MSFLYGVDTRSGRRCRRRRSLKPQGIMQAQRAMLLYYSLQLTDAFKHVC